MFQNLSPLHVPLLTWQPHVDGQAHSQRVSLVDLFPSILHWLGIASPDIEQTGQLLPGPGAQPTGERVIYASNIAYGPETLAILAGQNKAMYWPQENRFRFFDLEQDPGEQQPIESDELLLKFSTLAGDYLALPPYYSSSAPQPGQNQLEDLQAIGYLQGVDEPQDAPQQDPDAANETSD